MAKQTLEKKPAAKQPLDERARELIPEGAPKGILVIDSVERGLVGNGPSRKTGVQRGYMKITYVINALNDKNFAANVAANAGQMGAEKVHDVFALNNSIRIDDAWVQQGWVKSDQKQTMEEFAAAGLIQFDSIIPPDVPLGEKVWRLDFEGNVSLWERKSEEMTFGDPA